MFLSFYFTKFFTCSYQQNVSNKIKTSKNEHDWTLLKYLNFLHHNRIKKQLRHFFLKILQKHYQFPILETLDMSGHFHQNSDSFQKLWCLFRYKNWTPSLTFFIRYCKDIVNLLIWVLWKCLIMPINDDSITL